MLQFQSEILRQVKQARRADQPRAPERVLKVVVGLNDRIQPNAIWNDLFSPSDRPPQHSERGDPVVIADHSGNTEIGRCFLRLANLDNGAFDRLSHYETALWRQVGQVLFTLNSLRRR